MKNLPGFHFGKRLFGPQNGQRAVEALHIEFAIKCPHELQPFELYWHSRAKDFGKTQQYKIFDCIECGCCSFVCPSRIPLVQYFRFAKSEIWAREREKKSAEDAKNRFEFKQFREEREKSEKAEKLAKAAAAQAAKKAARLTDLFQNPFKALANGDILAIVMIALCLGIALVVGGERFMHLRKLMDELLLLRRSNSSPASSTDCRYVRHSSPGSGCLQTGCHAGYCPPFHY